MKTLWIAFKDHEEEANNKFNPAKYVSEDGDAVRVMIYLRREKEITCAGCYLISDVGVKNIMKEYGEDNVSFGKSSYDLTEKHWIDIETLITLKEIQKSIDALAAVIDLKDF